MSRPGKPAASETIDATLRNDLAEIGRVAAMVERFAHHHALPAGVSHDVHVCLDEILSNIIRHAFGDGSPHEIRLRVAVAASQVLIEVIDDGKPFDPLAPGPAACTPPRPPAPGGLGIYFVRQLMDELSYRREGRFNRLLARKNIPARR